MERVAAIKRAREQRFWQERMQPNQEKEKERDHKELVQGLDILVSPLAQKEQQKVAKCAKQRQAEKV